MDGADVQEFYEYASTIYPQDRNLLTNDRHTVIPTNFRIAATARYIHPNHLNPHHSTAYSETTRLTQA